MLGKTPLPFSSRPGRERYQHLAPYILGGLGKRVNESRGIRRPTFHAPTQGRPSLFITGKTGLTQRFS